MFGIRAIFACVPEFLVVYNTYVTITTYLRTRQHGTGTVECLPTYLKELHVRRK
jgi:hypothetical protein